VEELAAHFPSFEEHGLVACRFRNCRHRTEPGCAVIRLVEEGIIPAERYATYIGILGEVETDQAEIRSKEWR
jgi:ribosome biogenesis GTPase